MAALILPPRHSHVPEIGLDNNFLFEGFVFVFGSMVLLLQYINLYKTVWWLPQSHSNYALNFYLIDPYLSTLLVLIMGRRVTYVFLNEGFEARDTEISTRIRTHEKLLDNTNGIFTRNGQYIQASQIGSELEREMRRNATRAQRRHKKQQQRNQKQHRYIGSKETENQDNITLRTSNFCDIPRTAYARYTYVSQDNSSLFTLENILSMCEMDLLIQSQPTFTKTCVHTPQGRQCCQSWTLGNYLALLANRSSCIQITQSDFHFLSDLFLSCIEYRDLLMACGSRNSIAGRSSSFGDVEGRSAECASIPSHCVAHDAVYHILHDLTDVKFFTKSGHRGYSTHLTYVTSFLPVAAGHATEPLYLAITEDLGLKYRNIEIVGVCFGLKDILFERYLTSDVVWFILALVSIFFVMWLYTTSLFITMATIIALAISLEMSYFLYTMVFQIDFFPYMNLMTVVLLIGIGADDVFLYCRIWTLAHLEKNVGTLEKIISDTLKHAALSMFVTSFTTAAALYASMISHVTALRCFAIFGGTTVIMNFILMVTWIPATIVIHDKWCSGCSFCHDPEYYTKKKGFCYHLSSSVYKAYFHIIEWLRIFFEKVLPYIVIKFRYVWIILYGIVGLLGITAVLYYPKLRLPSSNEFQMFAQSHPFEVYDFKIKDNFWFEKAAGTTKATVPLTIVWGVKPVDTGNKLDPFSETELIYDPKFNIDSPEGQLFFLKFCRDVRSFKWYQKELGMQVTNCFIESFVEYMRQPCASPVGSYKPCCDESPFPFTLQVFSQCMEEWVTWVQKSQSLYYMHPNAGPRFSKENGKIVAVIVEFNSQQPYSFDYKDMKEFYSSVNEWVDEQMRMAPPGFQDAWFISDLGFFDLQQTIAVGTPVAIAVSISIATVFALLTTMNVLISLWAMVSITFTIFVVIGVLVLLGWELNIMESVTITVAVGLTIDFTLHYGMAYRLSPHIDREARVVCASVRVGSVVTAAALSSFLAGLLVLPSTIDAYRQLGKFLMLVMSISWLYATFFFQSLLRVLGPLGSFGQFHIPLCQCCYCECREKHVDKTVYTMSESTVSSSSTNHVNGSSELHELEPLTEEAMVEIHHHHPLECVEQDSNQEHDIGLFTERQHRTGNGHIVDHEQECESLMTDETSPKYIMRNDCTCVSKPDCSENQKVSKTKDACSCEDSSSICDHMKNSNNNILTQKEIFV